MQVSSLVLVIAALTLAGYRLGRARAISVVGGQRGVRDLHSLPGYYGLLTALWCAVPALVILCGWQMLGERIITAQTVSSMPADVRNLPPAELGLLTNDIKNIIGYLEG